MTHAFPAAIAAGDANALIDTLAPDVILYSAVTATPFVGREVVADTYRSVLESFEELRIMDEFESGDTHAFFWEGRLEGRAMRGADRIRLTLTARRARSPCSAARCPESRRSSPASGRASRAGVGWPGRKLLRLTALPLPPLPRCWTR